MGDTAAGALGGSNAYDHLHSTADTVLSLGNMSPHRHNAYASIATGTLGAALGWITRDGIKTSGTYSNEYINAYGGIVGEGEPHNHGWTGGAYTGGVSNVENRPKFISLLAIVKVF
jgi:hypothetical protein